MNALVRVMALGCLLWSSQGWSAVLNGPPGTPDPDAQYLFFLHGLFPEMRGPDAYHPPFQSNYETTALAQAFSNSGWTVITEIRKQGTVIDEYGALVARQIKYLIAGGVSPSKIAVVGHSKGGAITLSAAGQTEVQGISYVVLAGCALPKTTKLANETPRPDYLKLIEKYARGAKGRMLSLYDVEDGDFQTCREYADAAKDLKFEERVVNLGMARGLGHAAFYSPDPRWMTTVLNWLKN